MNLKKFLLQPHPYVFNWKSVAIPFLITAFILLVFKPFEFTEYSSTQLFIWSCVFGLIASCSVLIVVVLLKTFFPKLMQENNWKVWKEIMLILLVILIITLVIFILFWKQNPEMNTFDLLYKVLIRSIAISAIPVLILVLFEQYYFKKEQHTKLQNLNNELKIKRKKTEPAGIIQLYAENNKLVLQIDPAKIIYLKSEGNYVELFYVRERSVRKELIRNRLKVIELKLPTTMFIKCHKSYIINMQYILKAEGNLRNLQLNMQNVEEKIPVSRNYSKNFMNKVRDCI